MDLESLGRRVLRGIEGLGAGARGEARRVLDVLIERGDVSREEADGIEAGIESAIATHRRWLEERLARIEARLAARDPAE